MMNLVAICIVITSLLSAEVLSPAPNRNNDHVIVKEGHRVVVVEYDQDHHHNTKVSISPSEDQKGSAFDAAREKIKETDSVLPNVGQGVSHHAADRESSTEDGGHPHTARELICDAYGKCKHKIASAMGKAKDKTTETVGEETERYAHKAQDVTEEVKDGMDKAKETIKEKMTETVGKTTGTVGEELGKYTKKAQDVKEGAKASMEKARERAGEEKDKYTQKAQQMKDGFVDSMRTVAGDIERNATQTVGKVREIVAERARRLIKKVPAVAGGLMDLMNLLGFSSAYGMCLWVTFVSSYVLAGALPRQQFGVVQSRIYPVYFRAMSLSIGLALVGHVWRLFSSRAGLFQGFNLLTALLLVLANSLYLEPRATKAMFERMKIEKEEGRGRETTDIAGKGTTDPAAGSTAFTTTSTGPPAGAAVSGRTSQEGVARSKMVALGERLKKLNTYSSILNVLTMMSLTWHLVYLGQRLTEFG